MIERRFRRPFRLLAFAAMWISGCASLDHSPARISKTLDEAAASTVTNRTNSIAGDERHIVAKEPTRRAVRGQSPDDGQGPTNEGYLRGPMTPSSPRVAQQPGYGPPTGYNSPFAAPPVGGYTAAPNGTVGQQPPVGAYAQPHGGGVPSTYPAGQPFTTPYETSVQPGLPDINGPSILGDRPPPPQNFTPLDITAAETRTGRFMFGVGVNSDAGMTGQITIDERNFDIMNPPRSWDDVMNGTAWRGAGQGFRIEAQPGNQVQRYLISFTEPYLLDTPVSLGLSAFYFQRNYFDYYEERVGGRASLGYRLTPDLSVSAALRAEDVAISNPRVAGVPELDRVLGHTDFFSGRFTLAHDTRDNPFLASEGHYIETAFEQGFGEFSFPRVELDWRQYFKVRERPDGSGRHTLALSARVGVSGSDTPMFENYFAGGYSSLRGYSFRGASPVDSGVRIGGTFKFLGSAEYFFPITADDMVKGTVFVDYGTVEQSVEINDFRVAPGFGLLLNIPALGPAPLAINFAFPVSSADTDNRQVFSFFFGASR